MYNDNKKASNNRYLSKFKPFSLRIKPEEAERISEAAAEAGESMHGYIMGSVRARLDGAEHDSMRHDPDAATPEPGGYVLAPGVLDLATVSAEADGKSLGDWIAKAVTEQAAADKRGRALADQVRELQRKQQQTGK